VLGARVDALRAEVEEAERYARACRTAATKLQDRADALGAVSPVTGGMRSRSARINRARTRVGSACAAVDAVRTALSEVVCDLGGIARRYDRKADAARADLRAASLQLALATAGVA